MKTFRIIRWPLVFIVGAVAGILLFDGCGNRPVEEKEVIKFETDTVVNVVETLRIDTVWDTATVYVPVMQPTVPTKVEYDDASIVNRYEETYEDSTIAIGLTTHVNGVMRDWAINYKLKKPSLIEKTKTIDKVTTITNTVTELDTRRSLLLGAEFNLEDVNGSVGLGVSAAYKTKSDFILRYEYDVLRQAHGVGFMIDARKVFK